jgi:cobalt-zinc-cadmium efflux system membrane fusion protein
LKKMLTITAVGLLLTAAAMLAGCGSDNVSKKNGSGDNAVIIATARAGVLDGGTVLSGKLEALHAADVVPRTAGKVAGVYVDIGSAVAAGDLLLSLDVADLEALVELNAAQLERARNSDLPAQVNTAEFNLANSGALLKTTEADYRRYQQLYGTGAVSSQQLEQAERQYLQAKASNESAQNALDILLGATVPETIRQYEAQLRKAQADFENTMVKAPFSGVITARSINPGEMVSPTVPVISLANLDTVVVQADVSEGQVNKILAGQELEVRVKSVQEEPFTGIVTNVAQAASPASKAYPVKIQVANPLHMLKPGMFAEVVLSAGDEEGIIVPAEALLQDESGNFVWVVNEGVVTRRSVTAGQTDGSHVIINAGLTEGEDIAVTGTDSMQDGMKISVQD